MVNTFAHGLDLSNQEDDLAPPAPSGSGALALSDETYLTLFQETEHGFEEMCQILLD